MIAALGKLLLIVALPVVLFIAGGYPMMQMTGRDQFPARRAAPESVPLNFRIKGYDAAAAGAYWQWLGAEGRLAERRFLEADLVFPFLYGGALLASLLLAWAWLGRPFAPLWLAAPVAVTVIADWIENLVHWRELARVLRGEAVAPGWVQLASGATSAKLVGFWLCAALVVALGLWLVGRAAFGKP
jgi:hypothetical protein